MCYSLLNNENVGRIINNPKDIEILLAKLKFLKEYKRSGYLFWR